VTVGAITLRGRRRSGFDRPRFLWVVTAVVCVFMFAPIVIVALYSFNSSESLFSLQGFSLRWYQQALSSSSDGWRANLWVSTKIALITAAVSSVLGTALAFALQRGTRKIAAGSGGMIVLRLVCPETATAVASLLLFTKLGLILSQQTIVLGHIALCLPVVTVLVVSRIANLNPEAEESAIDLGATRLNALRLVVLPVIWPTIVVGAMLAFVISFDDFATSLFLSGSGTPTLPIRIYASLKQPVTPVVNAIGMLMMLTTSFAALVAVLVIRATRHRRHTTDPEPSSELG
jgi:spermidine/putrescine transport system permease protein/putrescine transport system permease protein